MRVVDPDSSTLYFLTGNRSSFISGSVRPGLISPTSWPVLNDILSEMTTAHHPVLVSSLLSTGNFKKWFLDYSVLNTYATTKR